jgi:hypothetical protein
MGKAYVVGMTVSVEGVTGDPLFARTSQWVCMDQVRRMGTMEGEESSSDFETYARAILKSKAIRGGEK